MPNIFSQLKRIVSNRKRQDDALVSVIILNRNGKDKLQILFNSLKKCNFYRNFEVIVVDNGSTDDSLTFMQSWAERLPLRVIANADNMTFSAANNIAAKDAKGEYLLFLNNDIEITDNWLDSLMETMKNTENPGAIGARLLYPELPEGHPQREKSKKIQHDGIAFKDKTRDKTYFIQPYNMKNGEEYEVASEPYTERIAVTAAVLLVRKTVFDEIGGFDENYNYGYEDVDLCLELRKAGYRNYMANQCVVYHYEFGTQSLDNEDEIKTRRRHNMEWFKGKWQIYLSEQLLSDKILKKHFYTEQILTLSICYDAEQWEHKEQRPRPLIKFIKEWKKQGYKVRYIHPREDKDWYDIGVGTDVCIIATDKFDVENMYHMKSDVLIVPWVSDSYNSIVNQGVDTCISMLQTNMHEELDEKQIDVLGAMPGDESKKYWGDWHYALALKKEFEKQGYKVVVRTRNDWYAHSNAKYRIVLRGNRAYYPTTDDNKKYIMWNISHPEDVTIKEYNLYDYVFFASQRMLDMYQSQIIPPAGVLLQCTDSETMQATDNHDKKYELLFVGNSRNVYRQILKDLLPTEHHLTVYGRHWEAYPVQDYVVSDYIDNEKVGQAYHDAKILLNDHWDDMRQYGIISNRIFDALAVGAFVISDDMTEIVEVFKGAVITYNDREDLTRKVDYYLAADEERQDKAKLGQEIVLREHTFAKRVEAIRRVMEAIS